MQVVKLLIFVFAEILMLLLRSFVQ